MSIRTRIATKTVAAGLALAAAGATTGVVAAAEQADEHRPETQAPADQASEGLQIAEDAKAKNDESVAEAEDTQAGELPEDLPEQAVADEVLDVITTWEGDKGADFGAAVSEAAQGNRNDASQDAGAAAADVRRDGDAPDGVRQDGDHRPSED